MPNEKSRPRADYSPRSLTAVFAVLILVAPRLAPAQSDVELAIQFFEAGGAYCFRLAAEGVPLSEETEWTVMVLTSRDNNRDRFRIRTVDAGRSGLTGRALNTSRTAVTSVWRLDRSRHAFFESFADGIESNTLRARVVKISRPGLAAMTPVARAEEYLTFADRGSQVSFKDVPDLVAEAFRKYATYFPD